MKEILDLYEKVGELRDKAKLDNKPEKGEVYNALVDSHNRGVDTVVSLLLTYLNTAGLQAAFNGAENEVTING